MYLKNRRENTSAASRPRKFLTGSIKYMQGHIAPDEGNISMHHASELKRDNVGEIVTPMEKVPLSLYPGDLILFHLALEPRKRIIG